MCDDDLYGFYVVYAMPTAETNAGLNAIAALRKAGVITVEEMARAAMRLFRDNAIAQSGGGI